MSDLDRAKKELAEQIGSPKVEALVEAMFLAATADGDLAPEEMLQFRATVEALTDKKLDGETVQGLVERFSRLLKQEGRPKRLEAIAARIPAGKPRETAILLAAAITASDGEIRGAENDLVADLAEALDVPPERAVELVSKVHRRLGQSTVDSRQSTAREDATPSTRAQWSRYASTSISTSMSSAMSRRTSTIVAAGGCAPKHSAWARPIAGHCVTSVTYMRVRTTSASVPPSSRNAASTISRQRRACAYASPGAWVPPPGRTGAVPPIHTWGPIATARQ